MDIVCIYISTFIIIYLNVDGKRSIKNYNLKWRELIDTLLNIVYSLIVATELIYASQHRSVNKYQQECPTANPQDGKPRLDYSTSDR